MLLVARVGSAVATLYVSSEYFLEPPYAVDPDVVEAVRGPLDDIAPRMCSWTVAGC